MEDNGIIRGWLILAERAAAKYDLEVNVAVRKKNQPEEPEKTA